MRRRILAMSLAFVMAMTPVNSYASGSPSAIPDSTTESKATIESEDIVNDDTVDMQEEPQELTYLQAEETDLGQKTRDEEGTSLECEAEAETYSKTTGIADNDELFAQYVNKVLEDDLFVDDVPATNALKAKARSVKTLSGNNKVVYDQLKEHIIKIANGQETSAIIPIYISDLIEKTSGYTAADLGVDAIVADGAMTQEAKTAMRNQLGFDLGIVMDYLLTDCPYELYWYDKTKGVQSSNLLYSASNNGTEWKIGYGSDQISFSFYVSKYYQKENVYMTDAAKTGAASNVANNAQNIVNAYASVDDYEKLIGYREEICEKTSYNHDAASDTYTGGYGDPWQLIWALDNDPSTNVVCEGYAKAFQYLCDLTDFQNAKTESRIVTGIMKGGTGEGRHMWNIMKMSDSKNYLVDVTNCDEGSIGYPDILFLAGTEGSPSTGYSFGSGKQMVTYTYDDDLTNRYDITELTLADSDYVPGQAVCTHSNLQRENAEDATCGTDGYTGDLVCADCGDVVEYGAVIEATGQHTWDQGTVTKEATGTEKGEKTYQCTVCHTSKTEKFSIDHGNVVASGDCGDDLKWELNEEGSLYIFGTGKMWDYRTSSNFHPCEWLDYKDDIIKVYFEEGITYIGQGAFSHAEDIDHNYIRSQYENITNVYFANTITRIDSFAFKYCSSLQNFSLPEGITSIGQEAFGYCDSLTELRLPDSIHNLDAGLCEDDTNLRYVYLGGKNATSYTVINNANPFSNCCSLEIIEVPEGNPLRVIDGVLYNWANKLITYPGGKKDRSFTVPSDVTLTRRCFSGAQYLETVILPEDCTFAPLEGCTGLVSITLPDSVESFSFVGCTNLKNVTLPNGIKEFSGKFSDCVSLESFVVPDSVERLSSGGSTFSGCTNLKNVTLSKNLTKIGINEFFDCVNLEAIVIPESVTEIDRSAFTRCKKLENVIIPKNVTRIGPFAFNQCENLQKVTFNGKVESIESGAFYSCPKLKNIVLPCDFDQSLINSLPGSKELTHSSDTTTEGAVDATCSSDGYTGDIICNRCNEVIEAGQVVKATGQHIWDQGRITKEPTYEEEGTKEYTCTICKEVKVESIPQLKLVIVASGYSGDTEWTLDENGCFKVTGSGAMRNYDYYKDVPWYQHASKITSVEVTEGVTSIGSYAFYGLENLTEVTMSDSVAKIGECAFKNCTGLEMVDMPERLTLLDNSAFYGCSSLKSIVIPEGIYTVWGYAFKNCTSLAEVTLPSSLIKIDEAAFYGCSSLEEIVIPKNNERNGETFIGEFAFKNCYKLKDITLPSTLKQVKEAAFYATAIETLDIPTGVTKIGPYSFKNCNNLVTLNLPETVTTIEESAFYGSAMETLVLPDSVTTLGAYSFKGCANLNDVTFSKNLKTIGDSAFYYCTSLSTINLGRCAVLNKIDGYAFKNCTELVDVVLPDSLTIIGDSAFYNCTNLTEFTVPENVTSIGEYCFSKDTKLRKVVFEGNAPEINEGAFSKVTAKIYVPKDDTSWTEAVKVNYGGTLTWMTSDTLKQ